MSDSGQFLAPDGATGAPVDAFYERILADNGGDIETAKASAKTQAKRIARAKRQVEITMPGNPAVIAGMVVNLAGFRQGITGRWKIVTVRHSLSRSGFTTSITGEGA